MKNYGKDDWKALEKSDPFRYSLAKSLNIIDGIFPPESAEELDAMILEHADLGWQHLVALSDFVEDGGAGEVVSEMNRALESMTESRECVESLVSFAAASKGIRKVMAGPF